MNVQQFNNSSSVSLSTYFIIAFPLTAISLLAIRLYGSRKGYILDTFYTVGEYSRHHEGLLSTTLRSFMDLSIVQRIHRWALDSI